MSEIKIPDRAIIDILDAVAIMASIINDNNVVVDSVITDHILKCLDRFENAYIEAKHKALYNGYR